MGGKEVLSSEVESSLPSKLKLFLNEWRHPHLSLTRIQPKRSKGWGPSGDKKNMVHVSLKQKHPSKLEQYLKWCYKLEGIEMGSQSYLQSNHNTFLPPPKKKNPNWSPWNQRGNLLSSNKHSKTHTNIRLTLALKEPPHRLAEFRGVQSPTTPMKLLHVF